MEDIQKICSRHFPGDHGNVLLYDAYGEWEKLYMDRHGIMEEVSGFFVYYEKNTLMSTYLSEYHGKKEQMAKRADLDEMDRFMELLHDAKGLMSRYRCAIMEVETKFKVLNEELSLQSDHNPIESIKSRLKAPESIFRLHWNP